MGNCKSKFPDCDCTITDDRRCLGREHRCICNWVIKDKHYTIFRRDDGYNRKLLTSIVYHYVGSMYCKSNNHQCICQTIDALNKSKDTDNKRCITVYLNDIHSLKKPKYEKSVNHEYKKYSFESSIIKSKCNHPKNRLHCKSQEHNCVCNMTDSVCKSKAHDCICFTKFKNKNKVCKANTHTQKEVCVCNDICSYGEKYVCDSHIHKCVCDRKVDYKCLGTKHPCLCLYLLKNKKDIKCCLAEDHPCVCYIEKNICLKHNL